MGVILPQRTSSRALSPSWRALYTSLTKSLCTIKCPWSTFTSSLAVTANFLDFTSHLTVTITNWRSCTYRSKAGTVISKSFKVSTLLSNWRQENHRKAMTLIQCSSHEPVNSFKLWDWKERSYLSCSMIIRMWHHSWLEGHRSVELTSKESSTSEKALSRWATSVDRYIAMHPF